MNESQPICRICGLPVAIRNEDNGPILRHLSDVQEADHGAVLDNGTYWVT